MVEKRKFWWEKSPPFCTELSGAVQTGLTVTFKQQDRPTGALSWCGLRLDQSFVRYSHKLWAIIVPSYLAGRRDLYCVDLVLVFKSYHGEPNLVTDMAGSGSIVLIIRNHRSCGQLMGSESFHGTMFQYYSLKLLFFIRSLTCPKYKVSLTTE